MVERRRPAFCGCSRAIALLFIVLCAGLEVKAAEASHSLIFVVDSSVQMSPHINDVKDTIISYIEQAERDEYLGVISFSSTAKLLAMKKITGPNDRKSLQIMLEALTAAGEAADIDRGVERALEEVVTLKRRGDKNVKGIVILSASTLADDRPAEYLDKILQDVAKAVRKDEWYIQYCFFNGARDARIAEFVRANDGFEYDIDNLKREMGTETIAEVYRITALPEERCSAAALDIQGAVLKQVTPLSDEWSSLKTAEPIEEGSRLNIAEGSRVVLTVEHFGKVGVDPATDIILQRVRRNPVSGKTGMVIELASGSLWMDVKKSAVLHARTSGISTEIAGTGGLMLREVSSEIEIAAFSGGLSVKADRSTQEPLVLAPNHTVTAKIGHILTEPAPAQAKQVEEWKYWSKSLIHGAPLTTIAFAIPEVTFPAGAVTLGPLKSKKTIAAAFPLHMVNVSATAKINFAVDVAVPLPQGIFISTALMDGNEPDMKQLQVKLDGSRGFSSGRNEEHKGLLIIAPAQDSAVKFEKVSIPMTVITTRGIPPASILIGLLAIIGAAGFAAARLYKKKEVVRPRPHRVVGRLIIIEDAAKGRTGSINLEEISTKSSRLSLVIGRDRTTEIRLKHASVKPNHCLIEAHLVEDHLVTYIEPIASSPVKLNGEPITTKTQLEDGARIDIGNFAFQFEDTQFYKKVEVSYSNGRQLSGILDVSGMDAEGFKISPIDAVSPSERARVRFSDIRSVVFYRRTVDILARKPRPQIKEGAMKRVELMFKRGDTISGYIQREYTEGRQRFVELLPLDPNSDVDYTVVEYSSVVEKKVL